MNKISVIGLLFLFGLVFSCNNTVPMPSQVSINNVIVEIEIADTDIKRATGLMFRETMLSNAGMLFIFEKEETPSFYMKNTAIPLDILFIDKNFKIVTIKQMSPFNAETYHRPSAPVLYALEVNQGWCEKNGVAEGMKVDFDDKDQ